MPRPNLYHLVLCLFTVCLWGQEPETFDRSDFDLNGPVKQCIVLTNYGNEEFDFDRRGRLLRSLTRYNEQDEDVTYYRYKDSLLVERRDEVYREGKFDAATSLAHFYQRDTVQLNDSTRVLRLNERILSYDRQIQEQHTYDYDFNGHLQRMLSATDEGVDEYRMTYEKKGDSLLRTTYRNDVLWRETLQFPLQDAEGQRQRVSRETTYNEGVPEHRVREHFGEHGKILERSEWTYDGPKQAYYLKEKQRFTYNANKVLEKEVLIRPNGREVREYIYQFDDQGKGNWVKQIVIPGNEYTTRKLRYFEPLPKVKG